jgi:hypothetical protein
MEYIVKENKNVISQKKMEGLLKLSEVIQWGRREPVHFIARFFGVE